MSRIAVNRTDLCVVPGPAFEACDEDGPYSDWRTFVVYRPMGPTPPLTLNVSFPRHGEAEAGAMVERIAAHGSINPDKWTTGDPWQAYHDGETLQQRLGAHGTQWQREQEEKQGCVA